ncbi:hypothetical protein [Ruegeria sp. SCP11]|uniref:hypothetical protein n=1 Tax=Ruegeria sp. SCP11 TaxID=3141378 RepID=UPI00333D1A1C
MSRILWFVLVALLISTAVVWAEESPSQNLEPIIGVEDWFDGCAQLSQETVLTVSKMNLDADCVALALDYCTQKQTNSFQDICHEILIDHIVLRSAEISRLLPSKPDLKGFKLSSYTNALRRASEAAQIQCGTDMSERECLLLDVTMKWLDLRFANRLLEGEIR